MAECTWHFIPQEGGYDSGPNNPLLQTISGNPWKGLVRESVQNSLDAVLDETEPVVVRFRTGYYSQERPDGFFELKKHIRACADYYPKDRTAQEIFPQMESVFVTLEDGSVHIPYIEVSDYNTRGMGYRRNDTSSPFYAFVRSAGVSAKEADRTGGSFGFGKSAYFRMSPIRTIFISSLTDCGEYAFEGVSLLCAHKYNGEIVSNVGFFDNAGGFPVTDPALIPGKFLRRQAGTSIHILGLHPDNNSVMEKEMIMAALQNFWLAIYQGRLEISVNRTIVSRSTLESLLEKYFPEEHDQKTRGQDYNPRPYYRAVKEYGANENVRRVTKDLPALGTVTLYMIKMAGARDKVIYMRRPLMKIQGKPAQTHYGVYGLFLCENREGDRVLRSMENPAHNEWKASNWTNLHNKIVARGRDAEKQIRDFIHEAITGEFGSADSATLEITGLDELLYIPEDLLASAQKRDERHSDSGAARPQIPDDAKRKEPPRAPLTGSVVVTERGSQKGPLLPDDEKQPMGTGHRNRVSREKGGHPAAGDTFAAGAVNEESGSYKTFLPVTFRAFAQQIQNQTWHKLIIHSEKSVENGEIEVVIASEEGDEIVPLAYATAGHYCENRIVGLPLKSGKNELHIRFADNLRHSIRLKAYEIQ